MGMAAGMGAFYIMAYCLFFFPYPGVVDSMNRNLFHFLAWGGAGLVYSFVKFSFQEDFWGPWYERDSEGVIPLQLACRMGHYFIFADFYANGQIRRWVTEARPWRFLFNGEPRYFGCSMLAGTSCMSGSMLLVDAVIGDTGSDPASCRSGSLGCIHIAAALGSQEMVLKLKEKDDMRRRVQWAWPAFSGESQSAFGIAAAHAEPSFVEWLISENITDFTIGLDGRDVISALLLRGALRTVKNLFRLIGFRSREFGEAIPFALLGPGSKDYQRFVAGLTKPVALVWPSQAMRILRNFPLSRVIAIDSVQPLPALPFYRCVATSGDLVQLIEERLAELGGEGAKGDDFVQALILGVLDRYGCYSELAAINQVCQAEVRRLDLVLRRPGHPIPREAICGIIGMMQPRRAWHAFRDIPGEDWHLYLSTGVHLTMWEVGGGLTTPLFEFISGMAPSEALRAIEALREAFRIQAAGRNIYFCPFQGVASCGCGAVQVKRHKPAMVRVGGFYWDSRYPKHQAAEGARERWEIAEAGS